MSLEIVLDWLTLPKSLVELSLELHLPYWWCFSVKSITTGDRFCTLHGIALSVRPIPPALNTSLKGPEALRSKFKCTGKEGITDNTNPDTVSGFEMPQNANNSTYYVKGAKTFCLRHQHRSLLLPMLPSNSWASWSTKLTAISCSSVTYSRRVGR